MNIRNAGLLGSSSRVQRRENVKIQCPNVAGGSFPFPPCNEMSQNLKHKQELKLRMPFVCVFNDNSGDT